MFRRTAVSLIALLVVAAGCAVDAGLTVGEQTSLDGAAGPDSNDPVPGDPAAPGTTATSDDGSGAETAAPATPEWDECDDIELVPGAELECATVVVPLDHDDPTGEQIEIALARIPARDANGRRGSILVNPGGPGASGIDMVAAMAGGTEFYFGDEVADTYDIVGFDPRGVGQSSPIECVDDAWLDAHVDVDDTPDTPEEEQLLEEADQGLTAACRDKYGDTLSLYSTESTARDMDILRAALGDERMTYYGASYGTYLGAVYATLFPDRVGALLLDAGFDPSGEDTHEIAVTQMAGFEQSFEDWARWCDTETSCVFATGAAGGSAARWDALRAQLDASPAPVEDREADGTVLEDATIAALYTTTYWPRLARALLDAESGDGHGLFSLTDEYYGRADDGTFDNSMQVEPVISCASGISDDPPADPEAAAAELRAAAPRFAGSVTAEDLAIEGVCTDLTGDVEPVELSYSGDGPIVVIGGINDPATPIRWSEKMVEALGPAAVLVTYDGAGHAALGSSECVTDVAAALFTEGAVPAAGSVCAQDEPLPRPDWFDSIPAIEGVEPVDLEGNQGALGLTPTELYAEASTTGLTVDEVVGRYEDALAEAGFEHFGNEALPDVAGEASQSVYFTPGGEVLVIVALDPTAIDDLFGDQSALLAELAPIDQTLVLAMSAPS